MTEINHQPKCAIIDANMLATIGLRQILEDVMPILQVDVFGTMSQLLAHHPEEYVHFFAAQDVVVGNMSFFAQHQVRTIVLTTQTDPSTWLTGFHSICTNQDEKMLVRNILQLEQHAHGQGRNLRLCRKSALISNERSATARWRCSRLLLGDISIRKSPICSASV